VSDGDDGGDGGGGGGGDLAPMSRQQAALSKQLSAGHIGVDGIVDGGGGGGSGGGGGGSINDSSSVTSFKELSIYRLTHETLRKVLQDADGVSSPGGAVQAELCLTHSLKATGFKPLPLTINPGLKNVAFQIQPAPLQPGGSSADERKHLIHNAVAVLDVTVGRCTLCILPTHPLLV
jgi:hypothetical protein